MEITRQYIRTEKELAQLQEQWKRLETGRDMTVFQSFAWNQLLLHEFLNYKTNRFTGAICVYCAKEGDKVRIILPLIIQKIATKSRWFGRKKGIYFLGHNSWSDYCNAVYDDSVSQEELISLIKRVKADFTNYTLYLMDIFPDTALDKAMLALGADVFFTRPAVYVPRRNSKEEYAESLSKHTKQNLRTSLNRMKTDGIDYSLTVLSAVSDESLLNQLTAIHKDRFIVKNLHKKQDILHRFANFCRTKVNTYKEENNNIVRDSMQKMPDSCLVLVRLNNEIAGYIYGLKDGTAIRIMQNCLLDKFKFYSPMFRGIYDFILSTYDDDAIDNVDFTRGDDNYKLLLGGVQITLNSYAF